MEKILDKYVEKTCYNGVAGNLKFQNVLIGRMEDCQYHEAVMLSSVWPVSSERLQRPCWGYHINSGSYGLPCLKIDERNKKNNKRRYRIQHPFDTCIIVIKLLTASTGIYIYL